MCVCRQLGLSKRVLNGCGCYGGHQVDKLFYKVVEDCTQIWHQMFVGAWIQMFC
jgi:hypothetical protein